MKRILITGAGSYIGTSVEKWLNQPQFNGMYLVDTVDMRGNEWKEKSFSGYDAIFHVAGIAHADIGKVKEKQKKLYYQVNCNLAVETAGKAKREGVKQFIYMSSIIIYGESTSIRKKRVITKETKPSPSNFYGDSKWRAEQELVSLSSDKFRIAILRPPMIYGEGCKGNYQKLKKIALYVPIFPDFPNERSVCGIENLSETVRKVIESNAEGVFFPQDDEYANTSELIKKLAAEKGKEVILLSQLNIIIYFLALCPGKIGRTINKAFGSLLYEK